MFAQIRAIRDSIFQEKSVRAIVFVIRSSNRVNLSPRRLSCDCRAQADLIYRKSPRIITAIRDVLSRPGYSNNKNKDDPHPECFLWRQACSGARDYVPRRQFDVARGTESKNAN